MFSTRFFAILTLSSALFIVGYSAHKIMNKPEVIAENATKAVAVATTGKKLEANNSNGLIDKFLGYIPDSTPYFLGSYEPVAFSEAILASEHLFTLFEGMDKVLDQAYIEKQSQFERISIMLLHTYGQIKQSPATAPEKFGFGSNLTYAFYETDGSPTLRLQLADKAAFARHLKNLHDKAGLQIKPKQLSGLTVFRYNDVKDRKTPGKKPAKPSNKDFIIAYDDNTALFTLVDKEKQSLTKVLGIESPESHLPKQRLTDIKKRHGFMPGYIGFVDHARLLDSVELVKTSNGEPAKAPQKAAAPDATTKPQDENYKPESNATDVLPPLRSAACIDELKNLAGHWPQTVFGYHKIKSHGKGTRLQGALVVESRDTELLQQLQKLRGYIPAHVQDLDSRPRMNIGVGIKVAELTDTVSFLVKRVANSSYQCKPFEEAKQSLVQSNPLMAVRMLSGIASGVEGVSLSILDFDGDINAKPQVMNSLDGMLMVSTQNPDMLVAGLKQMNPQLNALTLDPGGKPFSMPIPLTTDKKPVQIAQKGQHLLAFMGNKAEALATDLEDQPLKTNGFLVFNYDWGRLAKMSTVNMREYGKKAQAKDKDPMWELTTSNLESFEAHVINRVDITENGIRLDIELLKNNKQ